MSDEQDDPFNVTFKPQEERPLHVDDPNVHMRAYQLFYWEKDRLSRQPRKTVQSPYDEAREKYPNTF